MPTHDAAAMAGSLLSWGKDNGRQYPWRLVSDPYLLAVAEILLQKTKAADVEPVWKCLTNRFRTPTALARASDKNILSIVSGLGLGVQRTRRLKMMATAIAEGGDVSAKTPGLGPYGSGIVLLSLGLEPHIAPVDGNVARAICRHSGLGFEHGEPRKKPEVARAVEALMDTQDSPQDRLRLLYALVDLGQIICKPRMPAHLNCPLAVTCRTALRPVERQDRRSVPRPCPSSVCLPDDPQGYPK
jgi:A/G-specific adenine glycosylase